MTEQKKKARCPERQANAAAQDFECRLDSGAHNIHVDPRTGEKWGNGKLPRGFRRKWKKNYGNPKLHRHAASRGRAK